VDVDSQLLVPLLAGWDVDRKCRFSLFVKFQFLDFG
jgi:hypothetical protein